MRYRLARTRIFIPLHAGPGQARGTIGVKVYETDPPDLDWTLIEVPKLVARPQARIDFTVGEEQVMAATPVGSGISVVRSNPAVVVRDSFPPKRRSNPSAPIPASLISRFFEGFYRVLDARTGELLQERTGRNPNSGAAPPGKTLGDAGAVPTAHPY